MCGVWGLEKWAVCNFDCVAAKREIFQGELRILIQMRFRGGGALKLHLCPTANIAAFLFDNLPSNVGMLLLCFLSLKGL